jgi:hypothetical protein
MYYEEDREPFEEVDEEKSGEIIGHCDPVVYAGFSI